ncbi:MAG: hypothetical protein EAZ31_10535 [Cytophagia bacterium]|nr:MAG: hypothetical protein EAZ31_10535 [Cytophagia bacterium]
MCNFSLFAQNNIPANYQQLRNAATQAFQYLDKSQIPNGYLYEFGYPAFVPNHLNGIRTDSNKINALSWHISYASLYSMKVHGNQDMPNPESLQTQQRNFTDSNNGVIALPIFWVKYASFKQNAVSSNLLTLQNNQLYDVASRTQSPYQNQEAFAVTITKEKITNGASFVFKSDMLHSNFGLVPSQVQSLQANFDDGQGWRTLQWNVPLAVNYTQAGTKTIACRVILNNGSSKESHSNLEVKIENILEIYPYREDDFIDFAGGRMSISYSKKYAGLPQKLRKPLIVVEGFDSNQVAPLVNESDYRYRDFIHQINKWVIFNGQNVNYMSLLDDIGGYDLVFLNYANGTADITGVNVPFFQEVLQWVNTNKVNMPNGTREKNVVLGLSMGGLVARFGLAQMVRNGQNTDTRQLITYDSPHRGANIPLGFQALMGQFNNRLTNSVIFFKKALDKN